MERGGILGLIGSTVLLSGAIVTIWLFKDPMHAYFMDHPAVYPALTLGTALLISCAVLLLITDEMIVHRTWLERTAMATGLRGIQPKPILDKSLSRLPTVGEALWRILGNNRIGLRIEEEWTEAGFTDKPFHYLLAFFTASILGGLVGLRIGGGLITVALVVTAPILPRTIVRRRAVANRRRFHEQLPQVLDIIAAGLAAGLSLHEAIVFAQQDLRDPIRANVDRLVWRLRLGVPITEALSQWQQEAADESLSLLVEGVNLQYQFGGDLIRMLEETARVLRERVELEKEVHALTAQGRLSGIVIASLVPVSALFLLSFNPQYADIMMETIIGQVLVVITLCLLLVGWGVISRMVRIRY